MTDASATTNAAAAPETSPVQAVSSSDKTVLIVEDNDAMRLVARRQLDALGYRVLEAEDADRALDMLAANDKIDLLFTDIVMPGKTNGMELARMAVKRWPALRIILTSGTVDSDSAALLSGLRLLGKPYLKKDLERVLREVFEDPAGN